MSRQIKYQYIALIAIMAVLFHSGLFAQQNGIDTIQVNVITRYKPAIHDAVKLNSNPATADTISLPRNVKYDFINTQYPTTYTPPQIPALQIKGEPQEALYHSLLNLGGGNYGTLYGEYFYNSLRSKDWDYGFHLNHLSADYFTDNEGYSGYAFNDIDGYAEKFFHQHTLTLDAGFENHILYDFGYNSVEFPTITNDETRERYDLYKASLDYASTYRDSSKISHDFKIGYFNFGGLDDFDYNPLENNVNAEMKFFTYFNQQRIDLRASVDYDNYTYENPYTFAAVREYITYNTANVLLNPYFSTNEKYWDAHLGINAYYASNQINANNFNVYPDVLVRYHVAQDVVMLFAGIDGNQTLDTYKSLTDENPFTDPFLPLNYTYTQFHLFGGLTGSITSQLTYNVSAAQSMIKNMPLFVTDTLEPLRNRFTVVYDNVRVFNIHGDLDYQWNHNLIVILAGDYNMYTTSNQIKAWYNPALKISATGKYTIQLKYTVKAEFFVVGSQYAPETIDGVTTAKTLSGYPDLNLGLDYKFNKSFTAFLNLNNIASVAYYTWDNYEMERFNLLVGIRFGF
jgi:hypothetical protein